MKHSAGGRGAGQRSAQSGGRWHEMGSWSEKTPEFVGARYDRLAPIYGVFEWFYALPLVRVRGKSIDALELNPGDAGGASGAMPGA